MANSEPRYEKKSFFILRDFLNPYMCSVDHIIVFELLLCRLTFEIESIPQQTRPCVKLSCDNSCLRLDTQMWKH